MKKLKTTTGIQIALVCGLLFVWSWLPFVEVSKLSSSPLFGVVLAVAVYSLLVALCGFILWYICRWLRRMYLNWKRPDWQYVLLVFFVWSFAEWFTAWFVTVIWFGRGASFDSLMPFASFAPFATYTPLGFLARFVGFHGLSAVVVTGAICALAPRLRRYFVPVLGIIVFTTVLAWALYRTPNGTNIKAVVVAEALAHRVPRVETDADLVVFPEYGFDDVSSETVHQRLRATDEKDIIFVSSQRQYENVATKNVLIFGSTKQGFMKQTAKTRLIPAGEYLPLLIEAPLRVFRADTILQNFEITRTVLKGDEPATAFPTAAGMVIGAEACASIIAPHDYRVLTRQGATVLVNAASLEIFRSPVFDIQHQGLARFMAIANARPFLQSANSGAAFALDHNGRLLAQTLPVNTQEVVVQTNTKTTPYQLLGEWPVWIGGLLAGLYGAKVLGKKFRKPVSKK